MTTNLVNAATNSPTVLEIQLKLDAWQIANGALLAVIVFGAVSIINWLLREWRAK